MTTQAERAAATFAYIQENAERLDRDIAAALARETDSGVPCELSIVWDVGTTIGKWYPVLDYKAISDDFYERVRKARENVGKGQDG